MAKVWTDIVAGVRFLRANPLASSMTVGIVAAFSAVGAVLAIGPIFAQKTLSAEATGWGVLVTSFGIGMAIGMATVNKLVEFAERDRLFVWSLIAAAVTLWVLAAMPNITLAAIFTVVLGCFCGAAWVSGYVLLQENIADEYRGRTFGSLTVLSRFGLFLSLAAFPALAGLVVLAVATGVLAALVPAWISSRLDVVSALAGRRGIVRSRRRWVLLGLVLGAAGGGLAAFGAWRIDWVLIVIGLAVAEVGVVLCTPAIVGLVARLGRFMPLAPRIALRDTSRNRTAAAPAISAVMAAVVGSLAVSVVLIASTERDRDAYRSASRPGDVAVFVGGPKQAPGGQQSLPSEALASLRSIMPVEQVHAIGVTSCGPELCDVGMRPPPALDCPYAPYVLQHEPTAPEQRAARRDSRCDGVGDRYLYFGGLGSDRGLVVVIDATAAGAAANITTEDADVAAAALRAGDVVVDDERYLDNGRVTLAITTVSPEGQRRDTRTVTAPGFVLPHRTLAPIAMMTTTTARTLGLSSAPIITLATTSRMPTQEERDRLQAALGDRFSFTVVEEPSTDTTGLLVLAIVAGVITLGAAAIATGLAAADGRADLGTLAAVGASPGVRRMLSLSQSGVIAGLGSLLGAAAGLSASMAVLFALNQRYADIWPAPTPYRIAVPWLNVGIALLVVPLIAMLGAGLLTRSRLPIERRL